MAWQTIPGESSLLTEEDSRKRDMVKDLIQSENEVITEFAKHLVTVNFSAIGVVLALKEKWLGANPLFEQKMLLGIAVVLFLAAALLSTTAAGAYVHRVGLSDYSDVESELHRVARRRHTLTMLGFGVTVVGTMIIAFIAIWT
jgi:hypothetical protein